ncbi:MAG: hypothetical protein ACK5VX_08130, partial [Akkermansiaceae bacterium]
FKFSNLGMKIMIIRTLFLSCLCSMTSLSAVTAPIMNPQEGESWRTGLFGKAGIGKDFHHGDTEDTEISSLNEGKL